MALIDPNKLTEVRRTAIELLFATEEISFEVVVRGPKGKRLVATWQAGTVVGAQITMDLGPVKE